MRDGVGGIAETDLAAADDEPPFVHGSAPAITRASSVRPAPSSPAIPSTSPACSERLMPASGPCPTCSNRSSSSPRRRAHLGEVVGEIAIGHHPHELGDGHLLDRLGGDQPAVAHHGDPVADAEDLVEAVRDVHDRDPARRQALDEREELRDLGGWSATRSARP